MVSSTFNGVPSSTRELLDLRVALPFFQVNVPNCPACTPTSSSPCPSSSSTARAPRRSHNCVMCGGRGLAGSSISGDSWSMRIDPCLSCGSYLCAACRQVWHVQQLTQAKPWHPKASVDRRLVDFTSRLQQTELDISRSQAELALLERAAEQAAWRASADASTLEEEDAVRAAALAAEVCEAAAEADAITAIGANAQAIVAAAAMRCTHLRAESAKRKNSQALSLACDDKAIEEARARLRTVLDNAHRPPEVSTPKPSPQVAQEEAPAKLSFWDRLTGAKQPEPAVASRLSCSSDGNSSVERVSTSTAATSRRVSLGHSRLRRDVEDAHTCLNEQLSQVNQVHDHLAALVAEAGQLRSESDELRASIRSDALRTAEIKAEITAARTQVDRRRKDIQDTLEAEFRTFHELVMTALGELPAFEADLEKRNGALDQFARRLFAIERQLGLQQQTDGKLEQEARELLMQLATTEEDGNVDISQDKRLVHPESSDPESSVSPAPLAHPLPDVTATPSTTPTNPLRSFLTSAAEEERCARPVS